MAKEKKETKNSSSVKATEGKKKIKSSGKGERFADMSATAVIVSEKEIEKELQQAAPETAKTTKGPRVRGKEYQKVKKMVDPTKTYPPKEALELLKKVSFGQFNGTVETHLVVLEKGLSGDVNLPYFVGKARRVVIFNDTLVPEIKAGKINFDVLLALPADMPKILALAKILGPKGLMPNPKNGTLVPDPEKAMSNFSASALHFQTEKDFPLIHAAIGKVNQPIEELSANFETFIKAVNPKNIKKAMIKSSMSPSIKVAF